MWRDLSVLLAIGLFLTSAAHTQVRTFAGDLRKIGNGTARTWVVTDEAGAPQAIGVVFTGGALTGLPERPEVTEYILPLPQQASLTPFREVTMNWNPHGHIPPGIYDVPHFDFHFYMMPPTERALIRPDNEATAYLQPSPELIPEGYIAAPGGFEPYMGAHWVDPSSPEFHGQPFTSTLIYGFYDGRMVFIEPMASNDFLYTKPSVSVPLSQPAVYPRSGYYPTRYAIRYDAATDRYYVALQGLTWRQVSSAGQALERNAHVA